MLDTIAEAQVWLAAGNDCTVIWTAPADALAECLRAGSAPTQALQDWSREAQDVLDLTDRYPQQVTLIDPQLIRHATAETWPGPTAVLPMIDPVTTPRQAPDPARALATLLMPLAPQATSLWHALLTKSLTGPPDRPDLDADATVLSPMLRPNLSASDEITLLRDQVRFLTQSLDQMQARSLIQSAPKESSDAALEIALLRQQVEYLQTELDSTQPLRPSNTAASADNIVIEAAFARLLADLVAETERRIVAEQTLAVTRPTRAPLAPQATLAQNRPAIAPRPLAKLT